LFLNPILTGATIFAALLAITVNSKEIRIDAPSGLCNGEIDRVWLDVVFLVDSSAGMTEHGLRKADAFLRSVMRQMTIGEDTFQESRVGIITYAAEAHVVRDLSRSDNSSSSLPYSGDEEANLFGAFSSALEMFDNSTSSVHRKRAIVIAASTYTEDGPEDATQVAEQFKIAGGSVVTIDYRVAHSGLSPLASLASNGFAFTNDDLEVANLFNSLLHVNCFCPVDRHGATSTSYGSPDGGCFDDENIQADWELASELCHEEGGYLVKIDSDEKQKTMDNLASSPYWIGLRFNDARNRFFWQDWSQMNYTRWAPSQPDLSLGECAFSRGSHWYSAPCTGDKRGLADHVYFCEVKPCSANTDCYHQEAPFVTEPPLPEPSTVRPQEPSTESPVENSTVKPQEPSTESPVEPSTVRPQEPS
ncbi:hypothetical protein PMAYCL1PPCAC_15457, partial [Pristionchus mayeri]